MVNDWEQRERCGRKSMAFLPHLLNPHLMEQNILVCKGIIRGQTLLKKCCLLKSYRGKEGFTCQDQSTDRCRGITHLFTFNQVWKTITHPANLYDAQYSLREPGDQQFRNDLLCQQVCCRSSPKYQIGATPSFTTRHRQGNPLSLAVILHVAS